MASYNTSEFRKGLKVQIEGDPYLMIECNFVKPGKGQALYKCKLRNLLRGTVLDRTYKSGDSIDAAEIEEIQAQFLYRQGDQFVFMDNESFEQYEVPKETVDEAWKYLKEGMVCSIVLFNNRPISISPPNHVVLRVEYCEPAVRGNTATNVNKPCQRRDRGRDPLPGVRRHGRPDQDRHAHRRIPGAGEGIAAAMSALHAPVPHKPRREEVPPGTCLCDHCPAKCCRYFALTIEEPRDWEDFDFIRWYLLHERAAVFVEDGAWFLLVNNRCKYLGDDNRCRIYHTRPDICRGYNTAQLRVRRRLGLRPPLGNARTGRGIRRSRARAAQGEGHSEPQAKVLGVMVRSDRGQEVREVDTKTSREEQISGRSHWLLTVPAFPLFPFHFPTLNLDRRPRANFRPSTATANRLPSTANCQLP